MKLSTRSTYGMRALVELALLSGRGPVSAALIAKRQDLSVAYLEQLLHRLKKHGLVSSVRGPRGGYVLARDPQRITMSDVVRVLDGANGSAHEKSRERVTRTLARTHAQRIAQTVWRHVHDRLSESLASVTVADLCDEVREGTDEPLEHRYVFHI